MALGERPGARPPRPPPGWPTRALRTAALAVAAALLFVLGLAVVTLLSL